MKRTVLVGTACALALAGGAAVGSGCGSETPTMVVTGPAGPVNADGKSPATIEVKITRGGKSLDGGALRFSSGLDGSSFMMPIDDPSDRPGPEAQVYETSLNAGSATVRLYAIERKTAKVSVSYQNDEEGIASLSRTIDVVFGGSSPSAVDSIAFISAEPPTIQLKGSSGIEASTVTFQALDKNKLPVPDASIEFSLGGDLGGASLSPTSATTKFDGLVTTTLRSGTAIGTVVVRASPAGNSAVVGKSDPITVAGALPNYEHFSFKCSRFAIAGFRNYVLNLTCTAQVADRNGQKLQGIQVTFRAEAGSIEKVAYTDEQGRATVTYTTQDPKPADVAPSSIWPLAGKDKDPTYFGSFFHNPEDGGAEPSQPCTRDGKAATCNPRDGLVTVIAVTTGEEQWTDANGNGVWDPGEDFVDLPEPFVDANDNGQFDADDPREKALFNDVNHNSRWDGPNGKWDGSTQIWKSAKFLWTGDIDLVASGIFDESNRRLGNSLELPHCAPMPTHLKLLVVDSNLNQPASEAGDGLYCECTRDACSVGSPDVEFDPRSGGRRFYNLGVEDAHTCDPDCKSDEPPCGTRVGALQCTGSFTGAEEGADPMKLDNPGLTIGVSAK